MNQTTQQIVNALLPNVWGKLIRERSKKERAKYLADIKAMEAEELAKQVVPVMRDRGLKNKALINFNRGIAPPAVPDYILANIGANNGGPDNKSRSSGIPQK